MSAYDDAKARISANPQQYESTIAGNIERIEDSKIVIVHKLGQMVNLASDAQIDDAAITLDSLTIVSTGSARIAQGQSYVVPEGYYNGTFSVIADGQGHDLESKTIAWKIEAGATEGLDPTTQNVVTPSSGYYGLNSVTIPAIPSRFVDASIVASSVYASAPDILQGKSVVGKDGLVIQGSMANQSSWDASDHTLSATATSVSVPAGYHSGSTVSLVLETKTAELTTATHSVTPTQGKVLGEVVIPAVVASDWLPGWTPGTATADEILTGNTAWVNGVEIAGSMANVGAEVLELSATATEKTITEGYHNGNGKAKIVLENKAYSWTDLATATQPWSVTASNGKVLGTISMPSKPTNWIDTTIPSDHDATSSDIVTGKYAYANGALITGNMPVVTTLASEELTDEILAAGVTGATLHTFNYACYRQGAEVHIDGTLYTRLAAI